MAYTPQEWKPFQEGGTIITADSLNYMEQGIAATSQSQDELVDYCEQMDNDIRASVDAALVEQTDEFNRVMGENWDVLVARDIEVRDTLREEAATEHAAIRSEAATEHAAIRSEMAAISGVEVGYNDFTWSSSISANTVTKLSGGTVTGDGPATLSGQGVKIPSSARVAFLTCQMSLPITAATTGRRFGEVVKDSASSGVRQELYIGNGVGVSLVCYPGSVYYPQVYCGKAGTAQAWITVVTLV